VQTDILDRSPDNGQATGLGREHVNLVSALPHVAKEAFNGIGRLKMAVHGSRELAKRQGLLLLFHQTSHRFRIALAIFRFEGGQLAHGFLFGGLLPDAHQFNLDFPSLSSWDGTQDVALLIDEAALAWGGRKEMQYRIVCKGKAMIDLANPAAEVGAEGCM
jgi:hypothetical protein